MRVGWSRTSAIVDNSPAFEGTALREYRTRIADTPARAVTGEELRNPSHERPLDLHVPPRYRNPHKYLRFGCDKGGSATVRTAWAAKHPLLCRSSGSRSNSFSSGWAMCLVGCDEVEAEADRVRGRRRETRLSPSDRRRRRGSRLSPERRTTAFVGLTLRDASSATTGRTAVVTRRVLPATDHPHRGHGGHVAQARPNRISPVPQDRLVSSRAVPDLVQPVSDSA